MVDSSPDFLSKSDTVLSPESLSTRLASVNARSFARRLASLQNLYGNRVVQRMEWNRTEGAVETRSKTPGHTRTWIWAPTLDVNIGGVIVPPHPVHQESVNVGAKGNKLWASYTLVWVRGAMMIPENVLVHRGKILGPKTAKLGERKTGHTEQQVGAELNQAIVKAIVESGPPNANLEAIIVEVHQTNTPCSGKEGCALYLEREIMDQLDVRTNTLILRASADQLYESQTVHTYPAHPSAEVETITEDWSNRGLEGESVVVHNKVWKK